MSDKKLPKGWKFVTMGDSFTIERGGSPRPIKDFITDNKDGINWIKIGDTKGVTKYINSTKEKIKPEGLHKSRMVYEDDFILSNSMSFGRPFIMKTKGCIHDGWLVIRKNETINNDYLYLVLTSNQVYMQFCNLAKGSTVKNLNIEAVKKVIIPLPSLETQQVIVSKIEELFSELDKGIEDLKTAQQQLKTYRQSVLKWAFEGKLTNENVKDGELPKGWVVTTLGLACERIFDGTHFSPKNYPTGKYKYITAKNIKEKGIDLTKISYVSEEDHREIYSRSNVKKGDVLYIKDGATTGIACINNFDEEFSLLSSVGVFRVNPEKIESKYLCYFLNSQVTRNKMLSNIAGVAITRLTLIKLKNSEFVLAPFEEQHQIIQEIESRLSVADKMEESIAHSLLQAESLRQSILKKAFSGELVKEAVPQKVYKPKNAYFFQMQLIGKIAAISKKNKIEHGEMTIAKYAYLSDKIYGIPTGFQYDRWHLGPYPPAIKKVINNKHYFQRISNHIEVVNEETLFKSTNDYTTLIEDSISSLVTIFSKYKTPTERAHKTELLATVCKVIEDITTTDLKLVRASMKEWKIILKTSSFKNKAEKFNEEETKNCIEFIVKKGWDKKLIGFKRD